MITELSKKHTIPVPTLECAWITAVTILNHIRNSSVAEHFGSQVVDGPFGLGTHIADITLDIATLRTKSVRLRMISEYLSELRHFDKARAKGTRFVAASAAFGIARGRGQVPIDEVIAHCELAVTELANGAELARYAY